MKKCHGLAKNVFSEMSPERTKACTVRITEHLGEPNGQNFPMHELQVPEVWKELVTYSTGFNSSLQRNRANQRWQ